MIPFVKNYISILKLNFYLHENDSSALLGFVLNMGFSQPSLASFFTYVS